MAAAGVDIVCCSDRRLRHGVKLALTIKCNQNCPPAIYTRFIVSWKMEAFLYDQYFCDFAISQFKDTYFHKGERDVKYFVHCHCSKPYSLQCKSAILNLINIMKLCGMKLFGGESIIAPPICCNTWMCCPIEYFGAIRNNFYHCYCFQAGKVEQPFHLGWPDYYSVCVVPVHSRVNLLYVFCLCTHSEIVCIRRCGDYFNMLRFFLSCRYDTRQSESLELQFTSENESSDRRSSDSSLP